LLDVILRASDEDVRSLPAAGKDLNATALEQVPEKRDFSAE
jgi:hypothetical protein